MVRRTQRLFRRSRTWSNDSRRFSISGSPSQFGDLCAVPNIWIGLQMFPNFHNKFLFPILLWHLQTEHASHSQKLGFAL